MPHTPDEIAQLEAEREQQQFQAWRSGSLVMQGRIPVTSDEHDAIEALTAGKSGCSITRRDPGESGPLLVFDGTDTYEVDGKKVTKRG